MTPYEWMIVVLMVPTLLVLLWAWWPEEKTDHWTAWMLATIWFGGGLMWLFAQPVGPFDVAAGILSFACALGFFFKATKDRSRAKPRTGR